MKHLLIILLLSLLALIIHGYQFAVSDQEIFIPYILKSNNPTLFQNDLLFKQNSSVASLFYPLYGFLINLINIQTLFLVSFLIFQIFFFKAIFRLSKVIIRNDNFAYLSLLPFFLPKFIGGTATFTYDTFFGYRSIGVIFSIFCFSYLLEKKFLKALLFGTIGFLFHPLSIIPNIFLLIGKYIIDNLPSKIKQITWQKLLIPGIIFILIAISIIFFRNLFQDDSWLSIIKFRDDYLFPSTWSIKGWASFWMYILLILIFIRRLDVKTRKTILLFISISLTVFVAAYLLIEVFKIPHVAKFQLTRSINPLAYVALIISPFFIIRQKLIAKLIGAIAFISLSLNQFNIFLVTSIIFSLVTLNKSKDNRISASPKFIFATVVVIILLGTFLNLAGYKNLNNIQFPKQKNDWIDLQIWANNNTNVNAIFLVPPDQTGFRIFSNRPIVGDIKDGAVVMYSSVYAKKWSDLMIDLSTYGNFNESDFENLNSKYHFDYLVTQRTKRLSFEKVYENTSFAIYKI